MNPAFTTLAVVVGCLVLASAVWAAVGGRRRAPGALADVAIRAAAGLTTLALMCIAGAISYQHLLTLALQHGQHGWLGHAFPLSVDGVEIVASLRLLADQRIHVRSGWQPWTALAAGTAFSLFANVATAGPTLLDRVIAGWPALAFLAAAKLLAGMLDRHTTTDIAFNATSPPADAAPASAAPAHTGRPPAATPAVPDTDRTTAGGPVPEPNAAADHAEASDQPAHETVEDAGESTAPAAAPTRAVEQLPVDLMRRIPIHQDGYGRWQAQWADLQGDDVNVDEVAVRHRVGRRHLTWVRAAGQAGWLDHPDPPAWRMAALAAGTMTPGVNNQPHNDQPHNGQPYSGGPGGPGHASDPGAPDPDPSSGPQPNPRPVPAGR
jgi:hypothetical protein